MRVTHGYHVHDEDGGGGEEEPFRASRWLTACVRDALEQSAVDPSRQRVVAIVGTGLRELRSVELGIRRGAPVHREKLHFASAVREAAPAIERVITVSNACSAGSHALALGQDLLNVREADAVVVCATDSITESMLAMIGRFAEF